MHIKKKHFFKILADYFETEYLTAKKQIDMKDIKTVTDLEMDGELVRMLEMAHSSVLWIAEAYDNFPTRLLGSETVNIHGLFSKRIDEE